MAQQDSKPLKVLVPKVRQSLYIDTVVSEPLRVLAEAKAVKPLRDVFGHTAASTVSRIWSKFTIGGRACPSNPE